MNGETPTVTVIVPTYNSRATLRCALQSLIAQELGDFEAWIIGDACTDGSEEEVANLGDERLHWANLAVNVGNQWRPNNEGLQRARGRYIAFLGHDAYGCRGICPISWHAPKNPMQIFFTIFSSTWGRTECSM